MIHSWTAIWKLLAVLTALLAGEVLAAQNAHPLPPPPSPGKAVEDAARAAARDQVKTGVVEILSDTQGVDFGPYLQDLLPKVRKNWYALIPSNAQTKKGKLAIEFAVLKDGKIADMKLVATSGDVALDRAAWGGITASNPLPALPSAFKGLYLALRFHFLYNPDKADIAGNSTSAPVADPIVHAALVRPIVDSDLPKYPKDAVNAKVDGVVRLEAVVKTDGEVEDVKVLEGDPMLAQASIGAIKKWRFHPAEREEKPVEDLVRIQVVFRLDGEQVRVQVVWPKAAPSGKPVQ